MISLEQGTGFYRIPNSENVFVIMKTWKNYDRI